MILQILQGFYPPHAMRLHNTFFFWTQKPKKLILQKYEAHAKLIHEPEVHDI